MFRPTLSIISSPCVCGRRYQIKILTALWFLQLCFPISPLTFPKIDSTSQGQQKRPQLLCFNPSFMVSSLRWPSPTYGVQPRICVRAAGAHSPASLPVLIHPGDAIPWTIKTAQPEGAPAAGGWDLAHKTMLCESAEYSRVFSNECLFWIYFGFWIFWPFIYLL